MFDYERMFHEFVDEIKPVYSEIKHNHVKIYCRETPKIPEKIFSIYQIMDNEYDIYHNNVDVARLIINYISA
jgi:hypothetical protein